MTSFMTSFFNSQDKESGKKQKVEKHLILEFASLISQNNRQKTIEQISQLLDLSRNNFDMYCTQLIRSLFEWAQNLPATENSYYSKDATFIDHVLQRTLIALRNCHRYFTLHKDNLGLTDSNKNTSLYMLFSVGMLQGIGKIATDVEVTVYNDKGEHPKVWSPFNSSMRSFGTYLSYRFNDPTELNFKNRATLFLAQQLMPKKGLEWLIDNPNVFATWLALLDEDEEGGSAIAEILQLLLQLLMQANAESIRKNLEDVFFKNSLLTGKGQLSTYSNIFGAVLPASEDVSLAIQIMHFLMKGLIDGSIKINQSPLLAVPGGLIILPDIAQLFSENNPYRNQVVSWQEIQADLIAHQFHLTDSSGNAQLKTFSNPNGKHTGLVIAQSKFPLPQTFSVILPGSQTASRMTQSQFFNMPVNQLTNLVERHSSENFQANMQGLNVNK